MRHFTFARPRVRSHKPQIWWNFWSLLVGGSFAPCSFLKMLDHSQYGTLPFCLNWDLTPCPSGVPLSVGGALIFFVFICSLFLVPVLQRRESLCKHSTSIEMIIKPSSTFAVLRQLSDEGKSFIKADSCLTT
jgi:hypothetical protein